MPNSERNSRMAAASSIRRFSSGTRTTAIVLLLHRDAACGRQTQTPAEDFEEELEDLDVATGLVEVAAPGVQAVAAYQEAVRHRLLGGCELLPNGRGQGGDVL